LFSVHLARWGCFENYTSRTVGGSITFLRPAGHGTLKIISRASCPPAPSRISENHMVRSTFFFFSGGVSRPPGAVGGPSPESDRGHLGVSLGTELPKADPIGGAARQGRPRGPRALRAPTGGQLVA